MGWGFLVGAGYEWRFAKYMSAGLGLNYNYLGISDYWYDNHQAKRFAMRKSMATILILGVLTAMVLQPPTALAQQRSRAGGQSSGPLEFSALYGNMWGGNIQTRLGKFRIDTGDSWSVALSKPIRRGMSAEFSYTRQGTQVNQDYRGTRTKWMDMSVNYWQLGAIREVGRGDFTPFVLGSLGLTYYSPDRGGFDYEGTTYSLNSATKFSMAMGVGVKGFLGQAQRVGLRAQFRIMPTLYNTGAGLWFGTGGGGLTVTGSSIWQYEVSGGLVVKLGG